MMTMEDSMSAAVAWDLAPSRPQLRLVPTGDDVVAAPRPRVHLTRRGRLAITLAVTTLLAFVAMSFAAAAPAPGPAIDHTTTVSAGQTLSGIAASQLPQLPVSEGVAQIQLANNLSSADIHAGQTLLIPHVG